MTAHPSHLFEHDRGSGYDVCVGCNCIPTDPIAEKWCRPGKLYGRTADRLSAHLKAQGLKAPVGVNAQWHNGTRITDRMARNILHSVTRSVASMQDVCRDYGVSPSEVIRRWHAMGLPIPSADDKRLDWRARRGGGH